ncbi:YnbE family lipoprotein [Pontixanthobacter sp.]|uniref:YnbE family lipoprotein n=1 Tax=Pontixanthobacter sp. TaxID=2792078 RepID=UPI003C7BF008
MTAMKLTKARLKACSGAVRVPSQGGTARKGVGYYATAILMAGSMAVAGCINVNAPSEPIVIELNINITQEVIYRLAEDAGNTIDENADIF